MAIGSIFGRIIGRISPGENVQPDPMLAIPQSSEVIEQTALTQIGRIVCANLDRKLLLPVPHPYAYKAVALWHHYIGSESENSDLGVYLNAKPALLIFPHGAIRVHSALFDLLDEEELLFALAHEMGHLAKGHLIASAKKRIMGCMWDDGNYKSTELSDRKKLDQLITQWMQIEHNIEQESEADAFAVSCFRSRNWDQAAVITFIRKLQGQLKEGIVLYSHPVDNARLGHLRRLIFPDALTLHTG